MPEAEATQILEARNGDTLRLTVGYVAKMIAGRKVRMLAYNGSIPGPTLKVPQNAEITVLLVNQTPLPTTLHSHGVRMASPYDGVPGLSQPPVDSGRSFAYTLRFPDPGVFWYHPHVREDYQQELGLYGNYLVTPADSAYWPPVHREMTLMLDDILLKGNVIQPFYDGKIDFAMMGRFGNHFLINGDTDYVVHVKRNEIIRFYATNASGSRVYQLKYSDENLYLNIIGADNGRYEFPSNRDNDIVAPAERLIFQTEFRDPLEGWDTVELWHVTPNQIYTLVKFVYDPDSVTTDLTASISTSQNAFIAASIDPYRPLFGKTPDEDITLSGYMDMSKPLSTLGSGPMHDPDATNRMGFEWYDHMGAMNSLSDTTNMRWSIRDNKTGFINHAIHWAFKRNAVVKIRIHNDSAKIDPDHPTHMLHPMPHPIHFHGQRFLVVGENGRPNNDNLVWKDTYPIGTGFTVDLLLDAGNPGDWMFHCHLPEHMGTGMMGHFSVADSASAQ